MTTTVHNPLDELRLRLRGEVFEPGELEYADSCTLFNSMIDRRPRLVARCAAPDDVVAALACARDYELEIAVRAGGHSVAGLSLCDDGLVIDVRGMRDIAVDPERRVARVGAGVTWGELDRATQEHGLATTGGRVSTTGVAGLTLGGGSGWLERKHGLACDNLLAVELVTAEGALVRASADTNSDLLWALRGGGGNYGVVTSLEFRLHPVGPEVFAGCGLFPVERGREVLARFRDTMNAGAEGLSLMFAYMTAPDEDDVPAEIRGQLVAAVAGMYAGPVDEGERALAPIRELEPAADFFGPMAYADFQCSLDDPPGYRNYWTAEHVDDLPDEAIDVIAARSEQVPAGPGGLFIMAWGGAVARVGMDESPLAGRDARFVVHPMLMWEDSADDQRMISLGRAYRDDLARWATGDTYLNFIGDEGHGRLRAGFADSAVERLAEVKAAWDPEDVFHANPQHVRPRDAA